MAITTVDDELITSIRRRRCTNRPQPLPPPQLFRWQLTAITTSPGRPHAPPPLSSSWHLSASPLRRSPHPRIAFLTRLPFEMWLVARRVRGPLRCHSASDTRLTVQGHVSL